MGEADASVGEADASEGEADASEGEAGASVGKLRFCGKCRAGAVLAARLGIDIVSFV